MENRTFILYVVATSCVWLSIERERETEELERIGDKKNKGIKLISPSKRILNVSLLPEMSESRWTGPTVCLRELWSSDKEAWIWSKRPEAPTSILGRKWLCTAVWRGNTHHTHFRCDRGYNRTGKTSQRKSRCQEALGLPHTLEMNSWYRTDGLVTC